MQNRSARAGRFSDQTASPNHDAQSRDVRCGSWQRNHHRASASKALWDISRASVSIFKSLCGSGSQSCLPTLLKPWRKAGARRRQKRCEEQNQKPSQTGLQPLGAQRPCQDRSCGLETWSSCPPEKSFLAMVKWWMVSPPWMSRPLPESPRL